MPSWFRRKGSSLEYEDIEISNERGLFRNQSSVETYNGGIAPVTITVGEQDEAPYVDEPIERKKSRKKRKPMAMFVAKEEPSKQTPLAKKTGGNNKEAAAPNDLDFCCVQDGQLDCLGFDNVGLFGGSNDEKKKYQNTNKSNSTLGDDLCPSKDDDTTGTASSLEKIRSMGSVRDKGNNFSQSVSNFLGQCLPKEQEEPQKGSAVKLFIQKRLRYIAAAIVLLLIIIVSIILGVTLRRQKTNRPNEKESLIGTDVKTEDQIKVLLDKTPPSAWDDKWSPQSLALEWLVYEDTTALSMESEEDIQERFAAATLFFGTNGEEWKSSLGFLGKDSICDWNVEGTKEAMGIFCVDGRVTKINIVNHTMSGSLTTDLNYFIELVILNLYFNDLTGPIPDLSSLVKLEQMDLDDNNLSGKIPESLFNMPNLANLLLLFNNGLTGSIPEIEDSSRLVAVGLNGCSLTGTLPKSLGQLSSLRHVQLKGNNIQGTIPSNLISSPSLQTLGLEENNLSGSIPSVMVTQYGSKLETLGLGSNKLTGTLPDGVDDLSNLKVLYADNNKLTGSIRDTVMGLPKLEKLYLQGNSLTGDLSYFLAESNVLKDVYLGDNEFTGDLNDFLMVAPPSLERLDLSEMRSLGGWMSKSIGNFRSLKYFNVSGCRLGYEIPKEIGRLENLETLDLSWNDFQGTVPNEMADMVSLNWFDISRNRDLGGDLTNSLCRENLDLEYSLADCAGNIRVECECCTHCCTREGVCEPNENEN